MSLSIRDTQAEIYAWSTRNFGPVVPIAYDVSSFLGMVEEVGEIAHAILKMSQGIRGTRAKHEADVIDGIADLMVFTLDFAARNGLDAEKALEQVWAKVKQRDFTKDKQLGGSMAHCAACGKARICDFVIGLCAECREREAEIDVAGRGGEWRGEWQEPAPGTGGPAYSTTFAPGERVCPCWKTGEFKWVEGCPGHPRESMT